jgi:hypothetical protein
MITQKGNLLVLPDSVCNVLDVISNERRVGRFRVIRHESWVKAGASTQIPSATQNYPILRGEEAKSLT